MQEYFSSFASQAADIGFRILLSLIILFIGRFLIRTVTRQLNANRLLKQTESAVKTFSLSFLHIGLYALLIICVVGILGIPIATIAALITSAGLAIGLSFQGALANLAGGIMLIIFKPFNLGDYIEAAGISGTATEINLFYTVVITSDGKQVTIPNGNLMNTNITDHTAQEFRRVELKFTCARSENPSAIQKIMLRAIEQDERILSMPDPPFASISTSTNEAYEFIIRAWCPTKQYVDVYFGLTQSITEALAEAGIKAPAMHVITKNE